MGGAAAMGGPAPMGGAAPMGGPRLRSAARGADRPDDGARLSRMANLGEDRSRPRLCQRVHPSPATTPLALQVFDLLCCSLKVNEYIYDKRARLTWPSRDPDDEE
jgi:hypothetical protein